MLSWYHSNSSCNNYSSLNALNVPTQIESNFAFIFAKYENLFFFFFFSFY